jgi:hypothetical protein
MTKAHWVKHPSATGKLLSALQLSGACAVSVRDNPTPDPHFYRPSQPRPTITPRANVAVQASNAQEKHSTAKVEGGAEHPGGVCSPAASSRSNRKRIFKFWGLA